MENTAHYAKIENLVVLNHHVFLTSGWLPVPVALQEKARQERFPSVQGVELEYSKDGKRARVLSLPVSQNVLDVMYQTVEANELRKAREYGSQFFFRLADGGYEVKGKTDVYTVSADLETCTCPHFQYRIAGTGCKCSHIHWLRENLGCGK